MKYQLSPSVEDFEIEVRGFDGVVRVKKIVQPIVIWCECGWHCYETIVEHLKRLDDCIVAAKCVVGTNESNVVIGFYVAHRELNRIGILERTCHHISESPAPGVDCSL